MLNRLMKATEAGFSLIELLAALAILLIMIAFVLGAFTNSVKRSDRERALAERDAEVKRALELMSIEIGQAGENPEVLNANSNAATMGTMPINVGTQLSAAIATNTTAIGLKNANGNGLATTGLYPGRLISLTLPEGGANSESLQIATVNNGCAAPCVVTTAGTALTHALNDYISSPMLPNMFGILNPPPLTAGTPPALPLTASSKNLSTPDGSQRIGFIGDIYGDGNIEYIEYAWDVTTARLYRSITPITSTTKSTPYAILDNVTACAFTLTYPNTSTPLPIAVNISLTVQTSVAEPQIKGEIGNNIKYAMITATTQILPKGTYAASLLFSSAEQQLRQMMPPCQSKMGVPQGIGYPPCAAWSTAPWNAGPGVWNNVVNFAAKKYDNSVMEALP